MPPVYSFLKERCTYFIPKELFSSTRVRDGKVTSNNSCRYREQGEILGPGSYVLDIEQECDLCYVCVIFNYITNYANEINIYLQ